MPQGAEICPAAPMEKRMEGLRTGLRHRLERALRRVEDQHRLLRDVDAELARAAAAGAKSEVAEWLERKRDALIAHFEWEERVVFPAVHGLLPGTEHELAKLERDHGAFLEHVRRALVNNATPLGEEAGPEDAPVEAKARRRALFRLRPAVVTEVKCLQAPLKPVRAISSNTALFEPGSPAGNWC